MNKAYPPYRNTFRASEPMRAGTKVYLDRRPDLRGALYRGLHRMTGWRWAYNRGWRIRPVVSEELPYARVIGVSPDGYTQIEVWAGEGVGE